MEGNRTYLIVPTKTCRHVIGVQNRDFGRAPQPVAPHHHAVHPPIKGKSGEKVREGLREGLGPREGLKKA